MLTKEGEENTVAFRFWRPGMGKFEKIEVVNLTTREVIEVGYEQREKTGVDLESQKDFALPKNL